VEIPKRTEVVKVLGLWVKLLKLLERCGEGEMSFVDAEPWRKAIGATRSKSDNSPQGVG